MGAVYAHYVSFVSPDTFTHDDSITLICMVVLGGGGTFLGPILGGATVLMLAPELLDLLPTIGISLLAWLWWSP